MKCVESSARGGALTDDADRGVQLHQFLGEALDREAPSRDDRVGELARALRIVGNLPVRKAQAASVAKAIMARATRRDSIRLLPVWLLDVPERTHLQLGRSVGAIAVGPSHPAT